MYIGSCFLRDPRIVAEVVFDLKIFLSFCSKKWSLKCFAQLFSELRSPFHKLKPAIACFIRTRPSHVNTIHPPICKALASVTSAPAYPV